ncbi:MAG TPA: Ig-like domain-containing protein, partial [Thermoanaerobaculia bacterium]|nr:Ig-like domain-containing protein [Thermoanaerobaculia bacterium]
DALAREGTASVLVTRDSTAPSIVVDAPTQITRSRGATAKATVTDNLAVKSVAFQLNGTDLVTLTALPYQTAIAVPATANVGDALTLTIIATDTAGNTATATHTLRVAAEGAVTGQVLSDTTGLPLANARVRVANAPDRITTTDARGRYALPANESALVLIIDKAGHTTVERTVAIESGVGTVPVDARLTPRAPATSIGPAGGTLSATGMTVTFPAGASPSPTGAYLTPLSPQGLPNLLPLGWSTVTAFDVATNLPLANIPLPASLTGLTKTADLVFYKASLHAWVAVAASLTPSAGRLDLSLPEQGTYALAVRDDANVPAPVIGEPLQGVTMQPIPDSATSSGEVTPATLPVTGGNASGRLTVHSTTPLPSGTIVQTEVTEVFSLATGETASEEKRTQDIVMSRAGNDLAAEFPIVPSRSFAAGELVEGRVHLDILAGRETIRGKTGGSQPLSLDAGAVTVTIAAGSLPQDLAIAATPVILSSFLPATAAAIPHAEVVVDFSGVTLATPAELSIAAAGIAANESVVIARVERVGGVPKVIVAAATDRVGDRFVSRPLPGFFGLQTEGRYVFYRLLVPWGLVSGSAAAPRSPIVAQADGFPFVAIANGAGQFNLIAPIGNVRITASVPNTPFFAETAVSVTGSETATASLPLAAAQTTAIVTPANGAIRVPTSTQIEIAATAPLRASSANVSTIQLRHASGASVALRFVLSGSGRVLAVIPTNGLEPGQTYILTVNGLADDYGNGLTIDPVTFTTAAVVAPAYDTNRIVFTMPGADGMVTVSAPAGSLPPGTRILIVNSGNGVVVSYTAGNDGSFTGQFPATISDRLLVTITDPQGNVTNFERSRWESTDGSGRVAIGPAGGTVEGTGGTAIILPDGALTEGAVFKVEHFGPEEYEERPDFPGATFGGGLKITSEQMPTLKKEGDLVFPKPADAPPGSFYYVYRRLTGPDGQVAFQTIDHAFENADGKIV